MHVRYRGRKSYVTAPRVAWGDLTVQNVSQHLYRQGVEDKESGSDRDDVLLYDSSDRVSSFYTSYSPSLSVSSTEKMHIPVTFVWKGVTGHLNLHLVPAIDSTTNTSLSASASAWCIRQRSHVGTEGANEDEGSDNDGDELHGVSSGDGRKMVTAILRSLSKSVFSLYQGVKSAQAIRQQKETIKKLR